MVKSNSSTRSPRAHPVAQRLRCRPTATRVTPPARRCATACRGSSKDGMIGMEEAKANPALATRIDWKRIFAFEP